MSKVSGNLLFLFKKRVIEKRGMQFYQRLVESTDDDVQKILSDTIFSQQYYPVKVFKQGLQALMDLTSKEEIISEAEYKAEYQLHKFFGLVKKILSIDFALKHINTLWQKNYTSGHIEVLNNEEGYYKIRIDDYEWGEAQLIGFEAYLRKAAELLTKKKCRSSRARTDERTTYIEVRCLDT